MIREEIFKVDQNYFFCRDSNYWFHESGNKILNMYLHKVTHLGHIWENINDGLANNVYRLSIFKN